RFGEEGHPANHNGVAPQWKRVISEHYRACDAVIGNALQYADNETLFITLSDHGMNSFQRGGHLDTWLHDQGLLAFRPGVRPGEEAGGFFRGGDWRRTKAHGVVTVGV